MAGKLDKFSKKYGFFTSEASSEEIVAISKELSDVMYDHTKTLTKNSIALLGISIAAVLFGFFVLTLLEPEKLGNYKTTVFFVRIAGIAIFVAASVTAVLAITAAEKGASYSPMMWRNVRETASDEKVYEQMLAVKKINKQIYTARNYVKSTSMLLLFGTLLIALTFFIQRLVESGYLT